MHVALWMIWPSMGKPSVRGVGWGVAPHHGQTWHVHFALAGLRDDKTELSGLKVCWCEVAGTKQNKLDMYSSAWSLPTQSTNNYNGPHLENLTCTPLTLALQGPGRSNTKRTEVDTLAGFRESRLHLSCAL